MAASGKVVLRTAMRGDVFKLDEDTEVTYDGTEFPSRQAAEDAIAIAAESGVQLYVTQPTEDVEADDRTAAALAASGLLDEEPESKKKPAQQSGGSQTGGSN